MSMKSIVASTAALALIAATPAFAAKGQSESAAGSGAKSKKERKICRSFDNSASRMKAEKLCLTREQWKKFEAAQ